MGDSTRIGRGAVRALRAAAFAVSLLSLAQPASAADRASAIVLRLRGEALAAQDRCAEALPLFARAAAAAPEDARVKLRSGQCLIRLGRYPAAAEALETASALEPGAADVDLYRGIALYHLGDIDGAEAALAAARGHTRDVGQFELYSGLVQLHREHLREAALALERAHRADPDAVEPTASYYAGRAWQAEAELERARIALARVVDGHPGSVWSREASRALAPRRGPPGRRWLNGSAGFEYDSNLVLSGNSVDVSDTDDVRGVWSLDAGSELFRTDAWSGGVSGAYSGNAQLDLRRFDTHYSTAAAWIDRELGRAARARLLVDFGYARVGHQDFLLSHRSQLSLLRGWRSFGQTVVTGLFDWNDYRFPLGVFPDADRDGVGAGVQIEQRLPLAAGKLELFAAYSFQRYWSQGSEYDFDAHELSVGGSAAMPAEIQLDARASYSYQPFENASIFRTPGLGAREDQIVEARVSAHRLLGRSLGIALEYSYTHADSNVPVFEYDRHVAGLRATFSLD